MKKILLTISASALAISCSTTGKFTQEQIKSGNIEIVSSHDDSSMFRSEMQGRSINKAFAEVKELIKKEPNNANHFSDAAALYVMMGNNDQAIEFAKRAIRLNLDASDRPRRILAQAYLRSNKLDLALIILNSIGGQDSKDAEIHNMLGMVSLRKNERTFAMNHFKKAIELQPSIVSARMNLGLLYLKYQQLDSAQDQFVQVLKSFPDHADAKLHLAIIDSQEGRYNEAVAAFTDILDDDSNNAVALYNMAVLHNNTKKYEEALGFLKSYLRTKRARTHSTEAAFALLEEVKLNIQKEQEALAKASEKEDSKSKAKDTEKVVRPVDSTLGH